MLISSYDASAVPNSRRSFRAIANIPRIAKHQRVVARYIEPQVSRFVQERADGVEQIRIPLRSAARGSFQFYWSFSLADSSLLR